MESDIVTCPHCGKRNRVPAAAAGKPRCANCHQWLPWIAAAGDGDFTDVAEKPSIPVLVDLWAPWCGPCRMVAPELEKVAARQAGKIVVAKVNTDVLTDLGARFGISSIPTMAVFSSGKETARTAGARPARDIEIFIDQATHALHS